MKYILVAIDYVSKWVREIALPNNEARSFITLLRKNIFSRSGASPYQLVYGKAFYLSIEIDHKALWALKKVNLEWKDAAKSRLNNITYEISAIHKDKMKLYHDRKIEKWVIEKGNQVLLYNSRLYLFPGKLTSRCHGPFIFSKVYSYGAIELQKDGSQLFK
ncbi:uncharacterized protein LOC124890793, partial [Capsicum annuum]|uniref:uncharacterized protein LOC124890793 n=1 Tax=Capsicum annuum TaxID=4072 RepID=UPI001FB06540